MSKIVPPENDNAARKRETEMPIREFTYYTRHLSPFIEGTKRAVWTTDIDAKNSLSESLYAARGLMPATAR